jgi:hypothetical protein
MNKLGPKQTTLKLVEKNLYCFKSHAHIMVSTKEVL